jgi:hypothetical protein
MLSTSSITTFNRCKREYRYAYGLRRRSRRVAPALRFGSLFHLGLNAWWSDNVDASSRLVHAIQAIQVDPQTDPFDVAKAVALMTGYTARWGDERHKTIAVEQSFRMPLPSPSDASDGKYDIGGAIDAIVSRDGVLHNVEHKTTSSDISNGSDYWRHVVALDPQISTYEAASRAIGYDVRDTIYDVIRKPTITPYKATPEADRKYTKPTKAEPKPRLYATQRETDEAPEGYGARITEDIIRKPEWYFARMTVVRLEHDTAEHERDVWQTAQAIHFAERHDAWPRSPNACERYHQLCPFFDVCSGVASIDDEELFETKAFNGS